MKDKIIQEQKCLQAKAMIDFLRSNLLEIDNFKEFDKYERILKGLKQKINDIYWEL